MKKTFDEKIASYFTYINLTFKDKPAQNLIHQYADYVEVIALVSNPESVSSADILDRLNDDGVIEVELEEGETTAEGKDKNQNFVDNIFKELNDRFYIYTVDYPFEVTYNKLILKNNDSLKEKHKIYLYLLLSSNLNFLNEFQSELTSEFELVSYYALKRFMPQHAVVKSFGKNTDYPNGYAVDKMRRLAEDLKIGIDEKSISQISPLGTQERGLDLIAWIPFSDSVPNYVTILCQCACGKEWYKKLKETERYENYFQFYRNKPVHALFIPYSLIDFQNSGFYQSDELTNTLLFDRKRIIDNIDDDTFFKDFQSKIVVDKMIEFQEDIV